MSDKKTIILGVLFIFIFVIIGVFLKMAKDKKEVNLQALELERLRLIALQQSGGEQGFMDFMFS